MILIEREKGRKFDELRPLKFNLNIYEYASGSVLFECGKTKILCAVTLSQGVPSFLKGGGTGWLTAEYSMLPASTLTRIARESSTIKRNSRAIEISRLIGRSLRAAVNLNSLGEKTINVDCDVLQADGGTRTVSITGAFLALKIANEKWLKEGIISESIICEEVAAVSVGIVDNKVLLDLDYSEDSKAQVDCNFVLTRSGKIIEFQGSAEKSPMTWQQFDYMRSLAIKGVEDIFNFCDDHSLLNYKSKETNAYISC